MRCSVILFHIIVTVSGHVVAIVRVILKVVNIIITVEDKLSNFLFAQPPTLPGCHCRNDRAKYSEQEAFVLLSIPAEGLDRYLHLSIDQHCVD